MSKYIFGIKNNIPKTKWKQKKINKHENNKSLIHKCILGFQQMLFCTPKIHYWILKMHFGIQKCIFGYQKYKCIFEPQQGIFWIHSFQAEIFDYASEMFKGISSNVQFSIISLGKFLVFFWIFKRIFNQTFC